MPHSPRSGHEGMAFRGVVKPGVNLSEFEPVWSLLKNHGNNMKNLYDDAKVRQGWQGIIVNGRGVGFRVEAPHIAPMQLHIRMEEEGPAGVHAGVSTWAEVCACCDESRLPSQVVGYTRCQVSIILKTSGKLRCINIRVLARARTHIMWT